MRKSLLSIVLAFLLTQPYLAAAGDIDVLESVKVPEPSPKAMRYYRSGVVLWFVGEGWALLVPVVIVTTGLSSRLRNAAWKIGKQPFFAASLFGVFYLAIATIATLPLAFYAGYLRSHEYGLSNQSLSAWLLDEGKEFFVLVAITVALLWMPCWLLKWSPKRWWIWVTLGSVPVTFFFMFLAPIVIDPWFNKFGPMNNKALETKILALAGRAGIDGGSVFEVDKSKQTNTVNAYVKGFLGSKRIVLWDTTLAKLNDREVLFVMGHEMGHYVLGHVTRSMLLASLGTLICLGFVHFSARSSIRRFGNRWRLTGMDDLAALPLLLLLGEAFVLVTSPIGLAYSRYQEHEADRFALEITRDNHAGATAFVKMQHENLGNPRPGWLSILWRSTHPSLGERIDFCNEYRPWSKSSAAKPQSQYESLFRGEPFGREKVLQDR